MKDIKECKAAFMHQAPKMQRYMFEDDTWRRMTIAEIMFPDKRLRNAVSHCKKSFASNEKSLK